MSGEVTLTKASLRDGTWEGILAVEGGQLDIPPPMEALHMGQPVPGLSITPIEDSGRWKVSLPIPTELISDGVQTFVIAQAETGERLASFSLLAGDALAEDIRAEIDLLRAELDMLKRAFRRHCLETM